MIPYARQSIDDDDIAAVVAVLKGDWLTQGPHVAEFEEKVAAVAGARHAVAYSNGTAALHGACHAAGIGVGSVVATTALTFAASANCVRYVGADVELVDIDPGTLNIDLSKMPPCDAVIAVHYAGLPVDLSALASRPRVVIEDAAHALGAVTPDGPVGNCARSDMTMFSFHPVKHVTTGEGGVITTNDDGLADRLRRFRSHGAVPNPEHGGWYYEIAALGFNYRLTDIQAALGSSQLDKLERFGRRRDEIAARYRERLADVEVQLPPPAPSGFRHAHHLFPVQVENRRAVYDRLRARGIGVQVHYVPVYMHAPYRHLGDGASFPHTERAYSRLLSLPMFPALTDRELDTVIERFKEAL